MQSLLKQNGIKIDALLIDEKPTYSYTKIRGALDSRMTRTQELCRLDALPKGEMSKSVCAKLIGAIEQSIQQDKPNAIVFVDQCNYVVCDKVINHIQSICEGSTIVAASRFDITKFSKANVVVPNEAELRRSLGCTDGVSVTRMCKQLLSRADGPHNAIVTQASRGLPLATLDGQLVSTGSLVSAADVVDVTGAGDSLIAAVACTLSVASSSDLLLAAMIGNVAAAVQVKQHGVSGVSRSELLLELQQHTPFCSSKVVSRQLLVNIVQQMGERDPTVTIGWTSGCFDLLHAAQVASLQASKALCDVLVVGVNSDVSVRALKGPSRPIVPHKQRAFLLASLAAVDFVVVFDENSPVDIMRALQPDIFCKGSDYNRGQLNKEECVVIEEGGGIVKIVDIPRQEGSEHTTDFVQKIKGLKL